MDRFETGEYDDVKWVRGTAGWGNFKIRVFLYLLDGVLIDTGPVRLSKILVPFLDQQKIETIFLTHYHEDHSGNAPYLASRGIPVFVNARSVERCREKTSLPFYRGFFWGNREAFSPKPLQDRLAAGDSTFKAVFTPGHVFDHVAFYFPGKGFMFTGDLFVTSHPRMVLNTENTPRMIEDLKTVLSHDFKAVFCGHAGIIKGGREKLQEKLDFLQEMQGEVLHLHSKGYSVKQISRKLFPGKVHLEYFSCREWSSEHMVKSLVTGKATAENPRLRT